MLTKRQVGGFGLRTRYGSRSPRMGVGGRPRGPWVHLWDGSGCSRVRGRRGAGLRTDHSGSRGDVLIKHSQQHLKKVSSSSSSNSSTSSSRKKRNNNNNDNNNNNEILTGLCAPPGAGAPTADCPRPRRANTVITISILSNLTLLSIFYCCSLKWQLFCTESILFFSLSEVEF